MYKQFLIVIILITALKSVRGQDNQNLKWNTWATWGDQNDGTYRNPILPADYSDLDCIRVGDDYYAISSTFQYSPGIIILHSKDLANWTIKSHAVPDITQISPEMNWDRMNRYGNGIWAGAIRYHQGRFWIYFGTPDEGYFMTTAKNIKGPWTPLHKIMGEAGWDDCCPFWDDDGQGYFIGTNFKDNYKIHLFKLTADGKDIIKGTDKVIYQSKGSEANKLYKINGIYYHLFSEMKADGRTVMMERSKNIWGPYTEVKQLSHAQSCIKSPNQGGIVQTQKGDWYFLTHHGDGDWFGRIMSLIPVNWVDGWPILGKVGEDGIGTMVWEGRKPVAGKKIITPQTSDYFSGTRLNEQWEWNYQPRADKWSLKERKGWLRLYAFSSLEKNDNLTKVGNILTQRSMSTQANEVIVKLDLNRMADGQKAGFTHFGHPAYSAIGVRFDGKIKRLEYNLKGQITDGDQINQNILWLRSVWGLDGVSQYSYSTDGTNFKNFGPAYKLVWEAYRGDRLGIYSYNNKREKGYVDIDFFNYTFSGPEKQRNN